MNRFSLESNAFYNYVLLLVSFVYDDVIWRISSSTAAYRKSREIYSCNLQAQEKVLKTTPKTF